MSLEPTIKRTYVFFDGQNLFCHAKEAFGYKYPNYDPQKLANYICASKAWSINEINFYTGIPSASDKPFWNYFWTAKMAVMGTRGINGTDWIPIDRTTYASCLDPKDYRPKKP